jgi:hypothetical protein
MDQGQTTAIAALVGAAIGGVGGAMVAGEKGKRVLYSLGGVVIGAAAGGIAATLTKQATTTPPATTTGAGALPPHVAAIMR